MTAPTLYQHRIYCLTENAWVYLWKEDDVLLTTCPNDPGHTVQAGSAAVISTVDTGIVQINKEDGHPTNGHARVDALVLDTPAGATTFLTKTWDVDIAIYILRLAVTAACVGCTVTAEAAPLTAVGTLTADAPIGTTVLNVTPTAAANTDPGYVVTLQQGATVQELGQATAVDRTLNTITVMVATTSNFLAAGPTVVRVTARAADQVYLSLEGYLGFGESRTQAIPFPKGRSFRIAMTNPNVAAARLVTYLSYNY